MEIDNPTGTPSVKPREKGLVIFRVTFVEVVLCLINIVALLYILYFSFMFVCNRNTH